jgi:3-oxoacyl-(acyl-carrier-protein) synthase
MRRVVVTGVGLLSPLGDSMEALKSGIITSTSGVKYMHHWEEEMSDISTLIAAPIAEQDFTDIPRKHRRSMGKVALMTTRSMQDAIKDSGLEESQITKPSTGMSFRSTTVS